MWQQQQHIIMGIIGGIIIDDIIDGGVDNSISALATRQQHRRVKEQRCCAWKENGLWRIVEVAITTTNFEKPTHSAKTVLLTALWLE